MFVKDFKRHAIMVHIKRYTQYCGAYKRILRLHIFNTTLQYITV